ncbi:MAG: S9 family peptidase [Bacteroidales bacterium]|nr:S9 family peptidase [Bacteroidales bacterium]
MKKTFLMAAVTLATLLGGSAATAQNAAGMDKGTTKQITLEDIWQKGTFAPKGIQSIRSMKDGEHYCVLTRTGVEQYSYKTGEKTGVICAFNSPAKVKAKPMPPIESYEFDATESQMLLSAGYEPIYRRSGVSDYYLYNIKDATFTLLSVSGKQRLTTFSPDGTKVAYVRDNNLYWMDLATLEEHAVTTDGKLNEIINGTTDWVYEEEFSITKGFQWSPDSKKIAYMRFDESKVKEYNMQMWGELYPEDYRYKYPKAGEDNSKVELWIYYLDDNEKTRCAYTDEIIGWEYIPRFQWTPWGSLAFMCMNRLQNHMQISTNYGACLYTEHCDTYVDVPDTWRFITVGKGKKAQPMMLITSERDGYRHIYLYDMKGQLVKQVTSGNWEVCDVPGIDVENQRLYYTSREHGSTNKSLFVIGFDGKKKQCLNRQMTVQEAVASSYPYCYEYASGAIGNIYVTGTYNATFSNGCKYYIQTWSAANHAPVYTLRDAKGNLVKTLQDNAELQQKMADYGTGHKDIFAFPTSTGTSLDCYTIKPADFDSTKRYPVLIYVYGGPGNQQVNNSYGYSDYYWYHMLAQQGYVVFCFDGRGTGGRGAQFKKQTYKDLGRMECEDAIEAARWLGKQSWVDKERIGIWGWSFGGYLSTLSLLKGNDVFKSAIAVAPVTTWRYYDNIYTERFLQRPQDNPKGYDDNSPLNFADQLKGNYLLIHGTGDDNVHFQNAADLISALEKADKQFEMRIYPNKNHSIYGGNTRYNLYKCMTDFLMRKL